MIETKNVVAKIDNKYYSKIEFMDYVHSLRRFVATTEEYNKLLASIKGLQFI